MSFHHCQLNSNVPFVFCNLVHSLSLEINTILYCNIFSVYYSVVFNHLQCSRYEPKMFTGF